MNDGIMTFAKIILIMLGSTFGLALLIILISVVFKLTFRIMGNLFRFIGETLSDSLRLVGAIIAALLFSPMVLLCIVIGRWSASKHYAGAFASECRAGGRCVYRLIVGNPARLLGVSGALEGVEQRIPDAVAAAPGKDKPSRRVGKFDGYTIVGSLKGGGSGGKLYIAEPDDVKRAIFEKRNLDHVDQVVIKSFSLQDGSSLPQIVRESRALDAARKLGLVIEHEMAPDQFYYVMRYVPGESLALVTQNLHAMSSASGLEKDHLQSVMGYSRDLLIALSAYHGAGLWHKDVKPDNIIVDGRDRSARAHLVDFGLVTPLRSAMTLTTHGTEYFRDPELVRQALRGVKVHQIDGSKFDVYGAGAVLFSMIENSFPAHGGLSQITKNCPEALRWIVRRSMAEYDRRYPTAAAMLADIEVVLNADDPYAIKPAHLPSVRAGDAGSQPPINEEPVYPFGADSSAPKSGHPARAASPVPPRAAHQDSKGQRVGRPKTRVHGWWTGKYHVVNQSANPKRPTPSAVNPDQLEVPLYASRVQSLRAIDDRKPAKQQVRAARKRAAQMQSRAQARMNNRKGKLMPRGYSNTPASSGLFASAVGFLVFFMIVGLFAALVMPMVRSGQTSPSVSVQTGQHAPSVIVQDVPDAPLVVIDHEHPIDAIDHEQHRIVDASIMVVSDLPQPMSTQESEAILEGFEALRMHGVSLSGDLVDSDDQEESSMIDALAGLRHAVGAIPIDSPELTIKLLEWLDGQPVDGVLWLAHDPENPDQSVAVLVTDRFFWKQNPVDHSVVDRILSVLESNHYVPADSDE